MSWATPSDLETFANEAVAQLRARRTELARGHGERVSTWIDRRLDSDALEYLDRPDYPEARKLRQVRLLHLQNVATGTYRRCLSILRPALDASAAQREDGCPRVLELAAGSGELTMELARLIAKSGASIALTGSDVVDAYVDDANRRAHALGLAARFRHMDAFEMAGVAPGELDVVFIAQSTHHFTPGQLARMIARAGSVGARHFVSIDGYRSVLLLALLPLLAAVTLQREHMHDALLSARKLYSQPELALIAELAAPRAKIRVESHFPAYSVLRVDFPPPEVT